MIVAAPIGPTPTMLVTDVPMLALQQRSASSMLSASGKSGYVVNDLAGNQDPMPRCLIGDTDLSLDPSRFEFDEEGVET
jgi:hypothetical protein